LSNLVGWLVTFTGSSSSGSSSGSSGKSQTKYAGARLYSSAAFPPREKIDASALVNPLLHVRFAPSGGWIVICENNYWWYGGAVNPPSSLISVIQSGMNATPPYTLEDVFFTPNNDWLIKWTTSNGSRLYQGSDNFPAELLDIVNNLDTNGNTAELLCLAFPPPTGIPAPSPNALTSEPPASVEMSCIVICDQNKWQGYQNPPQDITSQLTTLVSKGYTLRSVVYSSSVGWLITMTNNAYYANGEFDQWLFKQIGEAVSQLGSQGLTLGDVVIEAPIRNYTFQILSVDAVQVRAGFPSPHDTLYGEASIQVVNQDTVTFPSPAPATDSFYFGNFIPSGYVIGANGNVPGYNSTSSPGIESTLPANPPPAYALTAGPVQISDPRASVVFAYTFLNQGSGNLGDLDSTEQLIAKAGIQIVSTAIEQLLDYLGASAVGSITSAILSQVSSDAFSNCDGVVAVDVISTSGATLMALAASQLGVYQTPNGAILFETTTYNNVNFTGSVYAAGSGSFCQAPTYTISWAIQEADSESPTTYTAPVSSGKTQVLFPTMEWPAGQAINDNDSTPQALAACVYLNKIYLFWKSNDATNTIWVGTSVDGHTWPAGKQIAGAPGASAPVPNATTNLPLAACVYENNNNQTFIYIFWIAIGSGAIFYSICSDGENWINGSAINNTDSSSATPAACVFQPSGSQRPQLYLFWKANDASNKIWWSAYAGNTDDFGLPSGVAGNAWPGGQPWPAGQEINPDFDWYTTNVTPTACVFQGKLYLFWTQTKNQIYFAASADGLNWPSPPGTMPGTINSVDTTPAALAACVFQNQLFLFWKATASSNRIYFSSSWDGQTWADGMVINEADSTPEALAACVFQNQISLFWKTNDASNGIYTSVSQRPFFVATTN
jgi:hypothetical protein